MRQLSCSVKPVTDYKLTRHGMDEARETSSKEDQDQSLVGFVQSLVGFVQSLVGFGKMLFSHFHLSLRYDPRSQPGALWIDPVVSI